MLLEHWPTLCSLFSAMVQVHQVFIVSSTIKQQFTFVHSTLFGEVSMSCPKEKEIVTYFCNYKPVDKPNLIRCLPLAKTGISPESGSVFPLGWGGQVPTRTPSSTWSSWASSAVDVLALKALLSPWNVQVIVRPPLFNLWGVISAPYSRNWKTLISEGRATSKICREG